jgi:hypothetical protein
MADKAGAEQFLFPAASLLRGLAPISVLSVNCAGFPVLASAWPNGPRSVFPLRFHGLAVNRGSSGLLAGFVCAAR